MKEDTNTPITQDDRLKVAAHTEEQIRAFCRSHMIPRPNVVRIRRPEDLHGWRSKRLLLLPSWWLGTNSDVVPLARDRGWELAYVTKDEVLNGPYEVLKATTPPAERPTPITDEARSQMQKYYDRGKLDLGIEKVLLDMAYLERQLAAVTEQRDEFAKRLRETAEQMIEARTDRDQLWKQRDRLAEALEKACAYPVTGDWWDEAQAALAAVKENTPNTQPPTP